MNDKIIKIFSLSLLVCFLGCGLSTIPIQPIVSGYIFWKDGEGIQYQEFSALTIKRASERTFQRLNIHDFKTEKIENGYKITSNTEKKFKLNIKQLKEIQATKISLRVNFLGDIELGNLFFSILEEELWTVNFDNGNPY